MNRIELIDLLMEHVDEGVLDHSTLSTLSQEELQELYQIFFGD